MNLKLLLKRGALLAAANWPVIAIQFVAQTTFQVLLAVPIVGAGILVATLAGGDLAELLRGSLRDMFTTIAGTLTSEPVALVAFMTAFSIVLLGGSMLMFLVKGGTVEVLLTAEAAVGPIELEPLTYDTTLPRLAILARAVHRWLPPAVPPLPCCSGIALMVVYAASGGAYLVFATYGYRTAGGRFLIIGWTFIAALAAILLVGLDHPGQLDVPAAAARDGLRGRRRRRRLRRGGALRPRPVPRGGRDLRCRPRPRRSPRRSRPRWRGRASGSSPSCRWSVSPCSPCSWRRSLLRGLVFEYIGLTALAAYATLYHRHVAQVGRVSDRNRLRASGLLDNPA